MPEQSPRIDRFSRTVASMDTPGGHQITCLLVMILGIALFAMPIKGADVLGRDIVILASGALFTNMRGKGSDNHDAGGKPDA